MPVTGVLLGIPSSNRITVRLISSPDSKFTVTIMVSEPSNPTLASVVKSSVATPEFTIIDPDCAVPAIKSALSVVPPRV